MNQSYELKITLTLKAPLISSGGGDVTRGWNRIFYRNSDGKLALQASHVKGKLREAINELTQMNALKSVNVDELFGKENGAGQYLPETAALHFSDFLFAGTASISKLTKVSINPQTGASKENFLQIMESIVPSGSLTEWHGKISFFAADDSAAKSLANNLTAGLKWITAVGGAKGSGCGRLEEVKTVLQPAQPSKQIAPVLPVNRDLSLIFEFENDLFVGGVTKKTSYAESQQIIPGAVIKGALAKFLNQLCGTQPLAKAIDAQNQLVQKQFPILAECFSSIHFSHAFPAPPAALVRPVTLPFSIVQAAATDSSKKPFVDVANKAEPFLDASGKAPVFQIDWKNDDGIKADFGWVNCEIINKTRTAIDPQTRRAKEDKLYTFQYLTPYAKNKQTTAKVRWIAYVRFPEMDDGKLQKLMDEFYQLMRSGWNTMGKRSTRFNCNFAAGRPPAKIRSSSDVFRNGEAIVSLQTDALLFDGSNLAAQRHTLNLHQIYNDYWQQATKQSCELVRFFARQKLMGGYLAKRYRLTPKYYPFVLTEAGSVFVLRANNLENATDCLRRLQEDGLPLPNEIVQRVPDDKQPWQVCPFVPENGYGEINLNLACHWDENFFTQLEGGGQ